MPAGHAPPDAVCRATLLFMRLTLGLLLPVLLSLYQWPPPADDTCAAELDCSPVRRLWRRAAAAVHRQLRFAAGMSESKVGRAVLCYFVLSYCWIFCKLLAGLV